MEMGMSRKERDLLKVMDQLVKGRISQQQAARWLGLSARQARRSQRRSEVDGDSGLIHHLRGRASNRAIDPVVRSWMRLRAGQDEKTAAPAGLGCGPHGTVRQRVQASLKAGADALFCF
jgi:hypothetical protein